MVSTKISAIFSKYIKFLTNLIAVLDIVVVDVRDAVFITVVVVVGGIVLEVVVVGMHNGPEESITVYQYVYR